MPTSMNCGKDEIREYLLTKKCKRVLDIGVGRGTYGILLEKVSYLVGVDVIDYRGVFEDINKYYNEYHIGDTRDVTFISGLGYFDLIIMGDVLEHISVEEAQNCLKQYKEISDSVLVAVPYEYKQVVETNTYENHVQDDLTHELFINRYEGFEILNSYNRKGKPFYGYYVWNRQKGV